MIRLKKIRSGLYGYKGYTIELLNNSEFHPGYFGYNTWRVTEEHDAVYLVWDCMYATLSDARKALSDFLSI